MQLDFSSNCKNLNSDMNFRGFKPSVDDLKRVKKVVDSNFSSFASTLTSEVKAKAPKIIKNLDGADLPKRSGFVKNALLGIRDLFEIPFDLVDDFASKFPKLKLGETKIMKNYRAHNLKERQIRALQGLYEDGAKIFDNTPPRGFFKKAAPQVQKSAKELNEELVKNLSKSLNDAMDFKKATYDTKKERFITRLVSGFTAAMFLGNDFFNNAKLKGKSDKEAKESQHLKQGQEIKENVLEGLMQFGVMACLSKFVNKNIWASALVGVAISTISRIISRKSSGMRLTRTDAPNDSLKEFQNALKNKEEYKTQSQKDKEAKKPILSLKNILLFCGASIACGFSLRALKLHTKPGQKLSALIKKYSKNFADKVNVDVVAKSSELEKLAKILKDCGENDLAQRFANLAKSGNDIKIGKTQKMTKLFGFLEVPTGELRKLPLLPFKIVKEVVYYPYKIAKKFAGALKIIKDSDAKSALDLKSLAKELKRAKYANPEEIAKGIGKINKGDLKDVLDDAYGIRNIYLRYKNFESKCGNDTSKLGNEFKNYVKKMRLVSLNNKTVSKLDNSKIAVIAQTTGTLSGMWFNMNDEYNNAIKNGDDKQSAQVAARKRGLNKFARMTSQVAISGALNAIFGRQYQSSLISGGIIVALSTFLTDIVSRQMTAMPTKKMNKEDIEKYQKNHKEGAMAWYYKLIDKLAS